MRDHERQYERWRSPSDQHRLDVDSPLAHRRLDCLSSDSLAKHDEALHHVSSDVPDARKANLAGIETVLGSPHETARAPQGARAVIAQGQGGKTGASRSSTTAARTAHDPRRRARAPRPRSFDRARARHRCRNGSGFRRRRGRSRLPPRARPDGALCRERRPRILAMAPDTVAWFAGYDGKVGSPILSWMPGSAWDGRMNQYVNFASCNAMMASTPTMFISANRWAALRSPRR
jgi:hypothetical protein